MYVPCCVPSLRRAAEEKKASCEATTDQLFMTHYAPTPRNLASRDVVIRASSIQVHQGRGVGPRIHLHQLPPEARVVRLPSISEVAKTLAAVNITANSRAH